MAALPLRLSASGRLEMLLITSRETGRWVIPKGNPMKGLKKPAVAAVEAVEEAGVIGVVDRDAYRSFDYWKRRSSGFALCHVDVYLMLATSFEANWKEAGERQRVWAPPFIAVHLVLEPGLQSLISSLADNVELMQRVREHAQSVDEGMLDLDAEPVDEPKPLLKANAGPWRYTG